MDNPFSVIFGKPLTTFLDPRIFAGVLLATMAIIYYTFR